MTSDLFYNLENGPWEEVSERQKRIIMHMENITIVFYRMLKGIITDKQHSHPNEQAAYIIDGRVKIIIGDQKQILGPACGYLVPANEKHYIEVLEDSFIIDFFCPKREDLLATK